MTPDVAYAVLAWLLAMYAVKHVAAARADARAKAAAEDKRRCDERMDVRAKGVTE